LIAGEARQQRKQHRALAAIARQELAQELAIVMTAGCAYGFCSFIHAVFTSLSLI
jgi:hypothetical protein